MNKIPPQKILNSIEKRFKNDRSRMRDAISILTKKQIIDDVDSVFKNEEVSIKYGLKMSLIFLEFIKIKKKARRV